jgi:hypothetical protein
MQDRRFNPSLLEEMIGAGAIAATIVISPLLRPWYNKWGATDDELKATWPGDDQVPDPVLETTRAIAIRAPAANVWPWLVQMGQGRGGLYSYERLENLVGCQIRNADRILPEHQEIEVGDKVRLVPEGRGGPYFLVTAVEPGRALILGGDDPPTSWGFILEPIDDGATRLVIRYRQQFERTFGNLLGWRVITEPISFWMERKMLQGIKARAEQG